MRVCVCLGAILIPEYLDFHSGHSAPRSRIAGRGRIMMSFFSLLTNIALCSGDSVEAVEKRKSFWWRREGSLGNNRILHIRFYCAVRSLYLWYLLRMPGMNAPRALVSRPLVKGSEALGTRLPSPRKRLYLKLPLLSTRRDYWRFPSSFAVPVLAFGHVSIITIWKQYSAIYKTITPHKFFFVPLWTHYPVTTRPLWWLLSFVDVPKPISFQIMTVNHVLV